MTKITKTRKRFTKRNLDKIKHHSPYQDHDGKWFDKAPKKYFATNVKGLCCFIYPKPSQQKSLYAHWSIKKLNEDGTHKYIGRYKYICDLHEKPLEEVFDEVNKNLKRWKKTKISAGTKTVGSLVEVFMAYGSQGYRVKTKGTKIKYKKKSTVGYNHSLDTYVLLKTKTPEIISMMTDPFRFNGRGYVTGALKDIPLDLVGKRDIEIFHTRMEKIPTAANRALAALSVAFEWDMKRSTDRLYLGDNNPCLRVSKYQESKDKKHLVLNKVIEVRNYCLNEQWRDPHFLTFYTLCLEVGERLEDLFGLVWHKPKSIKEVESCSGWLDLENKTIHLTDSKDRKEADPPLTDEAIQMLQQLQKYNSERKECAFALGTPWIFPRATDPSMPINNNSYRVKLKYFNYKFGLATRELVRSKKTRKLYKYKNEYTFKHLRKTFVTHYARGKNKDGTERGLVQASLRMRHSSPKVTKDHYFTEDQEQLRTAHMYETNVVEIKKKEQK